VSYALKLAGAAIALLFAGVIAIVIFSDIWLRIGLGAAFVIVCGGLLLFAWRVDKKDKAARAGLEDLPNV
jgi:Flp pilus assembly protein TadB